MANFLRWLRRVEVGVVGLIGFGGPVHAATCESLATLELPHAKVTRAEAVTDGNFTAPGSSVPLNGLPPFCRVAVVSSPTTDSLINIEVWLPLEKWNGKFEQLVIATHFVENDPKQGVAFQRPLCVYPKIARYDGKGDATKAESFTCR